MELGLEGRVAVVTGGSKGIGLAVVRGLLDEGARVVVASRTETPELRELRGELVHVAVDLTEPDAPAWVIERAVAAFGGLDVLVNNAGGPPPGVDLPRFGFLGLSDEDWLAMLDFNLLSAVRACRAALPRLAAREGAAIVNVSTGLALQPSAVNVDYTAAKAALMALTKALAEEFGPQGVRVNGICPGPVRTPWWTEEGGAADIFAAQTESDRETVLERLAPEMMQLHTGRLIEPREIADAVLLLASPRSGSTTGTELVVDGGLVKAA
ncbi:MAG TPA: SDR family oxidoreductase [Solirubrobacterales bacterium]|nr:SDR family oxidoreductase [Solirubrobacterales bacterium]